MDIQPIEVASSSEGTDRYEDPEESTDEQKLKPRDSKVNLDNAPARLYKKIFPTKQPWETELCFSDSQSKIDFVLVEEHSTERLNNKEKALKAIHDKWREKFKKQLKKTGAKIEEVSSLGNKKKIVYVLIHIPWELMCFCAEDLQLRTPLQVNPDVDENWSGRIFRCLRLKNPLSQNVPHPPPYYFTSTFRRSKIKKFHGSENKDTFFATKERQLVTYDILRRTAYGKKWRAEVGIDRLVDKKVFSAAFPLHDGPYEYPKTKSKSVGKHKKYRDLDNYIEIDDGDDDLNPRQILYKYWARWGCWYKYQPLGHIRQYFGEKIAIYFSYIGFYTAWLLPAAIVGLVTFIFGVALGGDTAVREACASSGEEFVMCPMCDNCKPWRYSDKCTWFKLASYLDNVGTVLFSIFMSFWAVTFLEYWKRNGATLSYRWDCTDIVQEEEQPRPSFAEKCVEYHYNPVTGVREPFFPGTSRRKRMVTGLGLLLLMIMVVVIFIIAIIVYRVSMTRMIGKKEEIENKEVFGQTIALVSSSIINLLVILILGKIYEKIAKRLTEWEMHRTQSEFEDQLIFKVFVFQFVNFYSAIVYIGFFKGRFVGYPGNYHTLFGIRQEEIIFFLISRPPEKSLLNNGNVANVCETGSCFMELAQQCAFIMVGKQVLNNIQEIVVPKIKKIYQNWKTAKSFVVTSVKNWEKDYFMIKNEGLFDEYLEIVIQFGFITIFVAAFPLAPLFALLNNWIEIRLDAQKFICETRRPVPERCKDIGVWFNILEGLARLSVVSNGFLIAFATQFLPKQLYRYSYGPGLHGFTNFSLAWAPSNYDGLPCRYVGYRDEEGNYTQFFWILVSVKLLFVIVFEHVVFGICKLIDFLVPDVPRSIEYKIKRERYLARQALTDADELFMRSNELD